MVRAVVAPDQRVPQRLARPGHAHGQWHEGEQDAVRLEVAFGERLVRPHARVVVDVAGLFLQALLDGHSETSKMTDSLVTSPTEAYS